MRATPATEEAGTRARALRRIAASTSYTPAVHPRGCRVTACRYGALAANEGLLALGDAHPGAEALTQGVQQLFSLLPLLADELAEDLSAIVLLIPAVGLNRLELGDQCLEQVVRAVVDRESITSLV